MPGTVDPANPLAAIDHFRSKALMTYEAFESDVLANHTKTFTLAGVADIDVIDHVFSELDKAIAIGTDFREFKASCAASLEQAWGGTVANPGWRLETIFRTNVQSAYQAGRYKEAREGQSDRPFGLFSDVQDDRESDICGDIGDDIRGKAISLDDPIWDKVWPPNHHDCRSDVVTLTEAEANEQGVLDPEDVPDPEDAEVADGFDHPPDEYEPDPEEYGELESDVERFVDPVSVQYYTLRKEFDENQPRDDHGMWSSDGGGTSGEIHVHDKEKFQKAAKNCFGRELSHQDIKDLASINESEIPGAHHTEYHVRPHGADGLQYEAIVTDKSGKELLKVRRQVETNWESGKKEVEVEHDLMVVLEDILGHGIGSKLFDRQVEKYIKDGIIDKITTDAAWTGQYQWPRLGFALSHPEQLEGLKSEAAQFLKGNWIPEKEVLSAMTKVKSIHDLSKLTTKSALDFEFESGKSVSTFQAGKAFLYDRGNYQHGIEISMHFGLRKGSKELATYRKVKAASVKK